jgi:hypothetical protein
VSQWVLLGAGLALALCIRRTARIVPADRVKPIRLALFSLKRWVGKEPDRDDYASGDGAWRDVDRESAAETMSQAADCAPFPFASEVRTYRSAGTHLPSGKSVPKCELRRFRETRTLETGASWLQLR